QPPALAGLKDNKAPAHLARIQFWDLPEWKKRYSPADPGRFEKECMHFEELARECREHGIKLVLVNMPLTRENRVLIPAALFRLYREKLHLVAEKYGATLVDLDNNSTFTVSDFIDSAHTNAAGGKKVQDQLMSALDGKNIL